VAANLRLEQYVQRKVRHAREFFYFRVVKVGREIRFPLPHPFSAEYRAAYDKAHREVFGIGPNEYASPSSISELSRQFRTSAKYKRLSPASKTGMDLSLNLIADRWGSFEAADIRPVHAQALYDSLAARPATANRRMDDISSAFSWGRTRGFSDENPCIKIERVDGEGGYEPWPADALETLIGLGKREIVKPALVALYTGQRRGDVLSKLTDSRIDGGVWYLEQGKTKADVPVPLHPIVLAIIDMEHSERRKAAIIDPKRPLLTNSRGLPWTTKGYGASLRTELIRLGLRPTRNEDYAEDQFRPTFHGFRHTNATLIASTVAKKPELFGGIARVKSMLGHMSAKMAAHYARRAEAEHMNAETMLLLPEIGNRPAWIGNPVE
jgi:integrase